MPRTQFQQAVENVQATASRMGGLVEDAIRNAVQALLNRDRGQATAVIKGDEQINKLHLQLREEVFSVIATQAPVARDLRLLLGLQYLSLIHISEPTRLGMISYAVFCLQK